MVVFCFRKLHVASFLSLLFLERCVEAAWDVAPAPSSLVESQPSDGPSWAQQWPALSSSTPAAWGLQAQRPPLQRAPLPQQLPQQLQSWAQQVQPQQQQLGLWGGQQQQQLGRAMQQPPGGASWTMPAGRTQSGAMPQAPPTLQQPPPQLGGFGAVPGAAASWSQPGGPILSSPWPPMQQQPPPPGEQLLQQPALPSSATREVAFTRWTPPGQIPNEDAPSLLWTGMDHDPRGEPPQLGDDGMAAPQGLFAGLAAAPGPLPNAITQ